MRSLLAQKKVYTILDGRILAICLIFCGLFCSSLLAKELHFDDLPWLDTKTVVGDTAVVDANYIHPTQFSVGQIEVDDRKEKIEKIEQGEYGTYMAARPVPVVIGPGGELYLIDRHHLVRAALETGHRKVVARVVANLSQLTLAEFWEEMQHRKWVYLYDEENRGPFDPKDLPKTIMEMKNDFYRGLAGLVRDAGGFLKSKTPFMEFVWAKFFREHFKLEDHDDIEKKVKEATKLALSKEAENLPGYLSCMNLFRY